MTIEFFSDAIPVALLAIYATWFVCRTIEHALSSTWSIQPNEQE